MSPPPAFSMRGGIRLVGWLVLTCAVGGTTLFAQQTTISVFAVGKKLDYLQSAATTPTSQTIIGDPNGAFHFFADLSGTNFNLLATPPKLTLPNATQYTLTGTNVKKSIAASYSNKAALDAGFPNGAYTFVAGSATLPVSLGASDAYPTEIPQITGGTWDGQGKLLINAASGATLNFNNFSNYATGVGGTITFNLYTVSGSTLGSELVAVDSVALSGYPSDVALASYTIAGGVLQADRTYYAELTFSRIVALNTSFLATLDALGLASYMKTTGVMISTASAVVAPAITSQPSNQTIPIGGSVTLTVAASGNPVPTFQWRKDGVAINGATFTSFSVGNAQLGDSGSYTVVASNGAGIATSDAAVLTVSPPPVAPAISTQPSNQTVTAGQPASFSVAATGTAPFSYQWKKGGVVISGATDATYTIAATATGDAGTYTVDVTNAVSSVTSNGATLTVNTGPAISTQPSDQTVTSGQPVSFSVVATGTAPLSYQWKKGGVAISGATGATYTITATTSGDAGTYTVAVTNSISSITSNGAALTINVVPVITTQPLSQTVAVGVVVTFTAAASGTPTPTYQWQKNGINITGATSDTYTIPSSSGNHIGTYRVVATNSAGSATSDAAVLEVLVPPGVVAPSDVVVSFTIE